MDDKKEINNLIELYKQALLEHCNNYAFQINDRYITYKDFDRDVSKVVKYLKNNIRQNIQIATTNNYYFAIAYFSIIISDNIAILSDNTTDIEKNKLKIEKTFTGEKIKNIIKDEIYEPIEYYQKYDDNKVSTIVFSSGTTKGSKGIMLSMRNITTNVVSCLKRVSYYNTDKCISIVPLSHIFGLIGDFLTTFCAGACMCVLETKYQLYSSLKTYRPNYLNLPPILIEQLLREIKEQCIEFTGNNIRRIMCAGAHISSKIIKEYREYNINIYRCYGLTETLCVSLCSEYDRNFNGVGKVLDCNEIRLDEEGQIYVYGKNVMIGYTATDIQPFVEIDNKRYLKTNDIGKIDKDGNLIIIGRIDNIIALKNGEKISKEMIEQRINELKGVIESKVIFNNNKIEVDIVADSSKKEIKEQIMQLNFGGSLIENIRYVNLIEKNVLGKVIRNGE